MDEDTTHGEEAADTAQAADAGAADQEARQEPVAETALDEELRQAIAERDARIGELEAQIEEASRSVEAANALAAQIEELRAGAEAEREGFELRLAGCRSVKAARALLPDFGGDVDALAAAEPWLFGAEAAQSGVTGLPSAGAAGGSDEAETARWREIAGLE